MIWMYLYLAIGFFIGIGVCMGASESIKGIAEFLAVVLLTMLVWPACLIYWRFF